MLKKYIAAIILLISFSSQSQSQTAFIGEYIIGPAPSDYVTIGEAINALKAGAVVGATTFKIKSGIYEEAVSIPLIPGANAANTLTFQSQSGNPSDVIIKAEGTTGANSHVIQLYGARFITIKNITVENTGISSASGILISPTTGSSSSGGNNTVEGCKILMDTLSSSGNIIGISIGYPDLNSNVGGTSCSYNTISNNIIIGGIVGINIRSSIISSYSDNVITNNKLSKIFKFGMYFEYAINSTITKNTISIRNNNSQYNRAEAAGIYSYYESNSIIANNFISGNLMKTTKGGGIYVDYNLNNLQIYHNSVNIETSSTDATGAFYILPFQNIDISNNIFNNYGGGYAFYLEGTSAYENAIISDYNNLYSTGNNIAFYHGPKAGLSDYKTTSSKDANSISVTPVFNSASDLHTFNPFLNEKGKSIPTIVDDIDAETRNLNTPDIGADEFSPLLYNITMESVKTIEPLSREQENTVQVVFRNDGINSLKDSIVLVSYSTDNGTTWSNPEQFKASALTTSYSKETFTFAKKWTVSKIKAYTLMARINAPGLRSDTKKLNETASVSLCLQLNGNISVGGTSPDFTTIAEAVQVISCGGINGPLTLNIRPGTYNERIVINEISGASLTNTITIRSESADANDVIISAAGAGITSDHHVVQINGTDFLTIENLTIENTYIGNYASGIHVTNAADNLTIKGCALKVDTTLNDNIYRLGITVSSLSDIFGAANNANDLLIEDCKFYGGAYGIRLAGASATHAKNIRINNNEFNYHSYLGLRTYYADITEISGNFISLRTDAIRPSYAILLSYSTSEINLNKNEILNPGINGISLEYVTGMNNRGLVSNNTITGSFIDTNAIAGIECYYCDSINFVFNSVEVNKPKSAAFYFRGDEESGITVLNNIFSNSGGGYAIDVDTTAGLAISNYNNLFTSGEFLAKVDKLEKTTLTEIQELDIIELSSISTAPLFISPINLHTFNPALDGKAIVYTQVINDIDGQLRNIGNPDIGADEFKVGADGALVNILFPSGELQANTPQLVTVKISNLGSIDLSNFPVTYTVNGSNPVTEILTDVIAIGKSLNYTFSQAWSPSTPGNNSLCIQIEIPADIDPVNDDLCKDYNVTAVEGIDGGVSAINSPSANINAFETQTITVQLNNYGNTVISNFPVSYKINSSTPVKENYSGSIPSGGSANFSFNAKWTPTIVGSYAICVETEISADINVGNNLLCQSVTVNEGLEIDGSVVSILSPSGSPKVNQAQTISVMLANLSATEISNVPVSYTINGATPVLETYTGTIPSSGTIDYTFTTQWTPTTSGIYTLCSESNIPNDIDISNDRKCAEYTVIQVGINSTETTRLIDLFPNPAENTLYLKTARIEPVHISIYNSLGQIVLGEFIELSNNASAINISLLEQGVYWLNIETSTGHIGKTFVKSIKN